MIKESIFEILNSIRKGKGLSPLDTIDDALRLRADLGFDSFDLAELTVNIEDKFGVDVFEDGIVETIGQLREKIEKNK